MENTEELVGVLHIKADSVVAHVVNILTVFNSVANFNDGVFSLPSKLEGICKQITKDLFYKRVVTLCARKGMNAPGHPTILDLLLKLGNDASNKRIQIDGLFEQFLPT